MCSIYRLKDSTNVNKVQNTGFETCLPVTEFFHVKGAVCSLGERF